MISCARGREVFRHALAFVFVLCGLSLPRVAQAWIFPEHTRLTARAVAALEVDPSYAPKLAAVLGVLRKELGLCATESAPCVSFTALPSLAGDHACSPGELAKYLHEARSDEKHWIFGVLAVALNTQREIDAGSGDDQVRIEARRQMHIDMQATDSSYVGRALVDYSHFQTTREGAEVDDGRGLPEYLALAFSTQREANATAAYANYHVAALRLAGAAHWDATNATNFLVRALLSEAFALHFLEDSFSAGHFVGHWGSTSMRLGTHDFYCGEGVEARTWADPTRTFRAHGDAFLSDEETERAGRTIAKSLAQVLDAATDARQARAYLDDVKRGFSDEAYDSCNALKVPLGLDALATAPPILAVLRDEPVPSPRSPETARVLAEDGWFFGFTGAVQSGIAGPNPSFGLNGLAGIRGGYGAGGLVNDPMNAQAFVELGGVGYRAYTEQRKGDLGVSFRLRAPGLLSVDGLFAILLAQNLQSKCPDCIWWAAAAAAGGLGHVWRSKRLFGAVRGQFAFLHDVTLNWFPNHRAHYYRVEVLAPVAAFRIGMPVAGRSSWAQAEDFYLDAGPMLDRTSDHGWYWGGFVSFSAAGRLFP
jgi:hypothetical protein